MGAIDELMRMAKDSNAESESEPAAEGKDASSTFDADRAEIFRRADESFTELNRYYRHMDYVTSSY